MNEIHKFLRGWQNHLTLTAFTYFCPNCSLN